MLMQNQYSLIYILKENWPEINLFSLAKILLHYNFHFKSIQKKKALWEKRVRENNDSELENKDDNEERSKFL